MNKLFTGLLLLAALLSSFTVKANDVPQVTAPISTVSIPVIQPLPVEEDFSLPWLDGRASLVGGLFTTSRRQFQYAEANNLVIVDSNNFFSLISSGYLQKLEGPNLRMNPDKTVHPYVLPSTKAFVIKLAYDFGQAGCGELVVNDALRFIDRKKPQAASSFSVHTRGMAVDIQVIYLSVPCETWLNEYLLAMETNLAVDATRENWKMVRGRKVPNHHFHLVVPLGPSPIVPSITN